jgi:hypothetical protein
MNSEEIKKIYKKYNAELYLSSDSKYDKYNISDPNLAEMIKKNIYSMDFEEKFILYKKIANDHIITRELMKYEMLNIVPRKVTNFNDFIEETKKILKRYYKVAGGFSYEDSEWSYYSGFKSKDLNLIKDIENNSSNKVNVNSHHQTKYELFENEFILENSLNFVNQYDIDAFDFIRNICKLIRKLNDNVKVKYNFLPNDKANIIWCIIFCKYDLK